MLRKALMITAALALSACATMDFAGDGLPKDLTRTNVQCGGSFVPGFTMLRGTLERFISHAAAEACGDADQVAQYTVVPAGVDVTDLGEVLAYLAARGDTNVRPTRVGRDSCSISADDRDPDGGCNADDGLAGSVGADGTRTSFTFSGNW